MPLTVEQILAGCTTGRLQSVGQMAVIPILDEGEAQDSTFGPPDLDAGTRGYGSVHVRNRSSDPTIIPTGAAFLTPEAAQDHALPGAKLLKGEQARDITNSYCVQQTQGGLIPVKEREFTILPAALRSHALAHRREGRYDAMWEHIREFRASFGDHGPGNLVEFVKRFEQELDQFVAQFECLPTQIGAIVMVGDKVVGVERAPNIAFWRRLWTPLIRVCYGSLALRYSRTNRVLPSTRAPLQLTSRSLDGLRGALEAAKAASASLVNATTQALASKALTESPEGEKLGKAEVLTVASQEYAGQVVVNKDRPVYASLCAAAV